MLKTNRQKKSESLKKKSYFKMDNQYYETPFYSFIFVFVGILFLFFQTGGEEGATGVFGGNFRIGKRPVY